MKYFSSILFLIILFADSCNRESGAQKKLPTGIYFLEDKPSPSSIELSTMNVVPGKYYLDTTAFLLEEDFEHIPEPGKTDTLSICLNAKGEALFKDKEYLMNGKKIALVLDGVLAGELKFDFEKHADDYDHAFILLANRARIISLADSLNKKWKSQEDKDSQNANHEVVQEHYRSGKIFSEEIFKDGGPRLHEEFYESGQLYKIYSDPDDSLEADSSFLREYFPNGKLRTSSKNFFWTIEKFGDGWCFNYDVNGKLTGVIHGGKNFYATMDYDKNGNLEFKDSTFQLPQFPGQNENEQPSVTYTEHYQDGKFYYEEHEYDRGKLDRVPCDFTFDILNYSYEKNIPTWQQLYKHDYDSARINLEIKK